MPANAPSSTPSAEEVEVLRAVDKHGDPFTARKRSNPVTFDALVRRLIRTGLLRTHQIIVDHRPFNTLILTDRGARMIA